MDAKSLPKVEMPNRNGFVPAVPVYPQSRNPVGGEHGGRGHRLAMSIRGDEGCAIVA